MHKKQGLKYLPIFSCIAVPLLAFFFTPEMKTVVNARHKCTWYLAQQKTTTHNRSCCKLAWITRGIQSSKGECDCMGNTYCALCIV